MLKHRLITGPILIAILFGVVILDHSLDSLRLHPGSLLSRLFRDADHLPRGLPMLGLGFIFILLASRELTSIVRANNIMARTWLIALASLTGLVLSYCIPVDAEAINAVALVASCLIAVFVVSILTFSRGRKVQGVLAAAGAVMFAMVYLGLMAGFLVALRREHSAWWIVAVIMTTKMCDTGAFFTGRAIGRHKLIVWLSPGKTWEGLIGGLITSGLVGALLAWMSTQWLAAPDQVSVLYGLICGIAFGAVGQFGDLTMSLFKRGAGLKDSGKTLPGLGGVLDVLDSPLMVAPVAYWMLAGL